MADLICIVVTPETTAIDTKAEFVALPLYDGELGVAPGHSPLIGRLGYGELRLRTGGKISSYYLDGGFVQISDNLISVLTNRAIPAGEVDVQGAREQLESAQKATPTTDDAFAKRDLDEQQARAQLRTAQRAGK